MLNKIKTKTSDVLLSIDPSVNSCGVCIFINGAPTHYELLTPKEARKQTYPNELDKLQAKCRELVVKVKGLVDLYKVTSIICEHPEHWDESGFVARESGALQKLTFFIGMVCFLDNVALVTPRQWKGQMPKLVTRNRLVKKYPDKDFATIDHNVIDAIGIGEWFCKKEKI